MNQLALIAGNEPGGIGVERTIYNICVARCCPYVKHLRFTLPNWSSLVRAVLLIQPSSAERAVGLLTNVFGSQRGSALHYNEVSCVMYFYFLYALVQQCEEGVELLVLCKEFHSLY